MMNQEAWQRWANKMAEEAYEYDKEITAWYYYDYLPKKRRQEDIERSKFIMKL